MKNTRAIVQVSLGLGAYVALRWFGLLSGWPNIPLPIGSIPVSGDSVQVVLSAGAALIPNAIDRLISAAWVSDAVSAPGRIREIHGATVRVPVVAEKPDE